MRLHAMSRSVFAVLSVVMAAAAVSFGGSDSAQAAIRVATDRDADIRFRLDGRKLTTTYTKERAPFGSGFPRIIRVRAACGTDPDNLTPGSFGQANGRWPKARRSRTFRLDRDVSSRVRWCVVEERKNGIDLASVTFKRR